MVYSFCLHVLTLMLLLVLKLMLLLMLLLLLLVLILMLWLRLMPLALLLMLMLHVLLHAHIADAVVCRHAFGDQYRATDLLVKEPGKLELVFTPQGGGEQQKWEVHQFEGAGVGMGMYNTEESITGFAKASFEYALDKQW